VSTDNEMDLRVEASPHATDDVLRKLAVHYGRDKLEAMEPKELYELYKEFARFK